MVHLYFLLGIIVANLWLGNFCHAEITKKILKEKQKRELVAPGDRAQPLSDETTGSGIQRRKEVESPPADQPLQILHQADKPGLQALGATKKTSVSTDSPAPTYHRIKANFLIGIDVVRGESGLVTGGQFGYAPFRGRPLYVGPEVHYALFSPGSMLSACAGGWYELRVYGAPRLSVVGGFLMGLGFPASFPKFSQKTFETHLDIALSQELNDLASVRGQFRPGIVDSRFAFMMNFNVSFRFR